jgi:hypothetical protein
VCDNIKNKDDGSDEFKNCKPGNLIGLKFDGQYNSLEEGIADQNFLKMRGSSSVAKFALDEATKEMKTGSDDWVEISAGGYPAERVNAMIPNFSNKTFGAKMTDWHKWRTANPNAGKTIVTRNSRGEAGKLTEEWELQNFYPLTIDASDGSIVDVSNRAR